jgi:hypothetical protein
MTDDEARALGVWVYTANMYDKFLEATEQFYKTIPDRESGTRILVQTRVKDLKKDATDLEFLNHLASAQILHTEREDK